VIGVIGAGQPGQVGDVLAENLIAVQVQTGQRLIGAVLRRQRL